MTIKARKTAKNFGKLGGPHKQGTHKPDWYERREIEEELYHWWTQQDQDDDWIEEQQDRMES